MSESTLTCSHLTVMLGGRTIINRADFSVSGLTALFGSNGSGKTTLMRAILGFIPSEGQISLSTDGGDISLSGMTGRERARYLSYVPQSAVRIPHIRVLDFITAGRTPYMGIFDSPKRSDYERAEAAAENHRIAHLLDRYMDELSGGERKTAYLARSEVQDARWMILDEPSAGLDYGRELEFFSRLRENCSKTGTGALVSIHNPHLAEKFCGTILVLRAGAMHESRDLWKDVGEMYGSAER